MRQVVILALTIAACGTALAVPGISEPGEYNRKDWGRWIDADKDCQDTRQEVLIAESRVEVTFTDEKQCRVATGEWLCPYTGQVFTDPSKLDIDHMVALRDAHDSGGAGWTKEQKRTYTNDLDNPSHLIAVSASANRSKRDKGPDEWLPTNEEFRCTYLREWSQVKQNFNLSTSDVEGALVEYIGKVCDVSLVPPLTQG